MSALDVAALANYVTTQRWYGAKDQSISAVEVLVDHTVAGDLRWLLLEVSFVSGDAATYQLVLPPGSVIDCADHPEVLRWMFPTLAVEEVRPVAGEQSNTSLVVDGSVIVKLFRRVGAPGDRNPDVEVVRALWDHGYRAVAEPIAEFRRHDRDLAVARRFLRSASSGWEMALDDPYFMDEARDLGLVTARLHVALAEIFGSQAAQAENWAASMRSQAARTPLPDGLDATEAFDRFARLADVGNAIRIHGDYHLGQVLHWRGSWYLLDFEGEPARPTAERVAPSSPLRDVAGMLRSFGYAASVGGLPPVWEREARRRFLDGYHAVEEVAALLPADPAAVLAAFELDKAIYEVGYERASRPDWEHVPLAAVRRLLQP